MKFSLEWLKVHLETQASAQEIADKLTAIGLEVEQLSNPAEALAPFRVAKVLTAEKHPQADKLQVLTVDDGSGEAIQVVCGAPNARAGMLGVFGPPGAYIPGSDMTLTVRAVRGVESRGMMCSSRELELGDDHSGIIELPADAPVGAAFSLYAGLDDPLFDVNVTPNRQDCMGVRGIARDLAAAGIGTLKPLAVPQIEGSFPCPVPILIDDPDGCPAFFGRAIRGVTNGASPEWMRRSGGIAGSAANAAGPACSRFRAAPLGLGGCCSKVRTAVRVRSPRAAPYSSAWRLTFAPSACQLVTSAGSSSKPSVSMVAVAAAAAGRLAAGMDEAVTIVCAAAVVAAAGDVTWAAVRSVWIPAWCSTLDTRCSATIPRTCSRRGSAERCQ